MHTLQPKQSKLKEDEIKKLLTKLNISLSQLPKISRNDVTLAEGCEKGSVIKIERKTDDGIFEYFRVVI